MNDRYSIQMKDIEVYKNRFYFSAREFNGLYSVDINGGPAEFVGTFPGESETKDLHSIVIRYENELVFLPAVADNICIYNLDNGNFTNYKYPVNRNSIDSINRQKVAAAILIDHEVYIFGDNNPGVLIFDFLTKKIKICEKWFEKAERYGLCQRDFYFCEDIAQLENSIFVKMRKSNLIIEYDTREDQFIVHAISMKEYPVINCVLASADEKLWMLYVENDDKKIISWNYQGVVKKIDLSKKLQDFPLAYEYSAVNGREIWFFPYPLNLPILIFNLNTEEMKTMYLKGMNYDLKEKNAIGECIWFRKVYGNKIFFRTVRGNELYCLRQNEEPVLCPDIFVERSEFANKVYDARQIMHEYKNEWGGGPSIEDLMGLCMTNHNRTGRNGNGGYGEIIKRYICKDC